MQNKGFLHRQQDGEDNDLVALLYHSAEVIRPGPMSLVHRLCLIAPRLRLQVFEERETGHMPKTLDRHTLS